MNELKEPSIPDDQSSLVEKIFDNPDRICEGEYMTIYEFLLSPSIRDDPDVIAGVLEEFSGWARFMLNRMRESGLLNNT
jgi:hypothetical protein